MAISRRRKKGKKLLEQQAPEQAGLNLKSVTWGDLTWINIEPPSERETQYLAEHYNFHPLDLDDCLSRIQRPKIDQYEDYLFLVLHFPVFNQQARVTTPGQISIFIGEKYLITMHKGDLKPLVKLFRDCELNEESLQENLSQGSGYLLYHIIDRLVDYCLPIVNKIMDNIDQVEDNVFSDNARGTVQGISVLRRDIISFRRIIWPMRAVIGSLEPKIRRFTTTDLAVYFGDTVDHVDRVWDALDEYKEIIEGLQDTHDSLASNRINDVLRVLTILATISAVLTIVASFYGMNVALPGGGNPGGNPLTWLMLLLAMLAIIGGMLLYFNRKHWL